MANEADSRYFVETAAHVLDVLESFYTQTEALSITEVARRAGLNYSCAFRLLHTLQKRGYVMRRPGKKRYLLTPTRKRYRIGYASLRTTEFHREVTDAITKAARNLGVTLITRNNDEFNVSKALMNADQLLAEHIDLLIEYQYSEAAGELIAARCHQAHVPVIGINFAQPGAYYFGGNNYETGTLAGKFLAQHTAALWPGRVNACLILPAEGLTSTQEARITGIREALRKNLSTLCNSAITVAPQVLTTKDGYEVTADFIRRMRPAKKPILIAALTDHLGLGAEKAIRFCGVQEHSILIGQGGGRDARARIACGGPFKASVAFFSECYGESVMSLAIKIIEGQKVPLTSYTHHVVLTAENLKQYYAT